MVKKHSEHKGPAPLPPSSVVKSVLNEESQNSSLVLKVQDSNQEQESLLVVENKELEVPKSKDNTFSGINDSINNNSKDEKPFNIDDKNHSASNQSVLRKHDILNPRPISVATSTNGSVVNSVEDSHIRTRRRSSSASNRNQRRPSPPSLDKVLQMNQTIEKNKGKMPTAVMNELTDRLQNNQDETDQTQDKDKSKYFAQPLLLFLYYYIIPIITRFINILIIY